MSEQIAHDSMTPPLTAASAPSPTCPLCHTLDHTITPDSLRTGGVWTCTRCGQAWSAARLAKAAAYAEYDAAH